MDYAGYYQKDLYPLQDRVLVIIGQIASDFYLTGGTALSRFYLYHRYSDDIDLFINRDEKFSDKVNEIILALQRQFEKVRIQLSDTDFLRAFVEDKGIELKIEFINDVEYHYLNTVQEEGWRLDNWQNILSNKISALSRNATKDFADILFLSLKYSFNWVELFEAAKRKDAWVNEIAAAEAIDAFDIQRFLEIRWINEQMDIKELKDHFNTIARDILMAGDNSLKSDNR